VERTRAPRDKPGDELVKLLAPTQENAGELHSLSQCHCRSNELCLLRISAPHFL